MNDKLELMTDLITKVASPEAIVQTEAASQKVLVHSTLLPTKSNVENGWDILQGWGITIEPNNDLFYTAILPAGWEKRSTNHHMWSNLIDNTGKIRATIFYKASFFDQAAHISPIVDRFYVTENTYNEETMQFVVKDRAILDKEKQYPTLHEGPIVRYAYHAKNPDAFGCIIGDEFHYHAIGTYSTAKFQYLVSSEVAVPMTQEEFYEKYNESSLYLQTKKAAQNIAKEGLQEWIKKFLDGRDQWSVE